MFIECTVSKIIHDKGGYRIIGCIPTEEYKSKIKVNADYGSFTIVGENLSALNEWKNYTMNIEEGRTDSRGTQYKVISIPSLENEMENITDEMEYEIMGNITSTAQTKYILEAYPQFIRMILDGREAEIDVKKIYNVGEIRLAFYIREIDKKFKFFQIMSTFSQYELKIDECKALGIRYKSLDEMKKAMETQPYHCMIEVMGRSFDGVDSKILSISPELRESFQRTEFLILDTLDRNEYDGNTKINANIMAKFAREKAPECIRKIKEVAVESDRIYFEESTKFIAKMATYLAEEEIAHEIIVRNSYSKVLDINWKPYVTRNNLTSEQGKLLENFCEHNFSVLLGWAGCVDKDTEYFNGIKWVKISEYQVGDKVLQYNMDNSTNLIEPQRYIKEPCDEMYHFHNKYGVDQMFSEDHDIVYRTSKGHINKKNVKEVVSMHYNCKSGFTGKFLSAFSYNEGVGIDLTDEEIRVMCAVISDGSFSSKSKPYDDFYITSPRIEKIFTSYWYDCSKHQLEIIADEILNWDGSVIGKRRSFSTTIKETADFVQFVFTSLGTRTTIQTYDRRGQFKIGENGKQYERKTKEYTVVLSSKSSYIGIGTQDEDKQEYKNSLIKQVPTLDGYKYCFTVPSGMLVLRRNDKIFITGNCGKTFSIKSLVELMEDNKLSYTLLAPTGKASAKLKESTGRPTSTIHRALGGGNKITTDVLIIDEGSFLAVDTMIMVLRGIERADTRIILVGDNQQLPSISCGNILNDLIESNIVPIAMLTKVFRYGEGGIATVATDIRNGKHFLNEGKTIQKIGKDYKFIQADDDSLLDVVLEEYNKLLERNINPKDILILSPYNVGDFGTYNINSNIQYLVNKPKSNELFHTIKKDRGVEITFKKGDLVINKKNDYKALPLEGWQQIEDSDYICEDDVEKSTVYNGDSGKALNIDDKHLFIQFGEEIIVYNKRKINQLLLSYAISVHSSQGSQALHVINIVSPMHSRMLNRNLLYVADSRAEKEHIDIGDVTTFNDAIDNVEPSLRQTFLLELLIKENERMVKEITNMAI